MSLISGPRNLLRLMSYVIALKTSETVLCFFVFFSVYGPIRIAKNCHSKQPTTLSLNLRFTQILFATIPNERHNYFKLNERFSFFLFLNPVLRSQSQISDKVSVVIISSHLGWTPGDQEVLLLV